MYSNRQSPQPPEAAKAQRRIAERLLCYHYTTRLAARRDLNPDLHLQKGDVLPAGSWAFNPANEGLIQTSLQDVIRIGSWQERRRWELNPLRPGCSRLPGRLAPASMQQYPGRGSNPDLDFRRVRCCPLHHQDRDQSRRLESHQHEAVYKTAALLFGHAGISRSARI
jgi:hypothetical protein